MTLKTAILVALILSLITSAVPVAAHDWVAPQQGPIGRSITTEAARLAAVQMKSDISTDADDSAWTGLQKVERGTAVDVLDRTGTVTRGRLAEADDVSLTLRDGALINRIARTDVIEVATTEKRSGSPSGAASGAALGILAAVFIAPRIAFSPCYGSCTDEKVMLGATIVGLPVGLGFAGYYGFGRTKPRVIYRASQRSS
jgi:hypothetical protein